MSENLISARKHAQFVMASADALEEAVSAAEQFPEWNSAHEGFGILLEEGKELFEHVCTNQKKRDLVAMRKEAIQVAACAIRFAAEVCSEERGRR